VPTDPKRLPAAALAAVAATASIAVGCSSASDAVDDLVDDFAEDNLTLEDVTDSNDQLTFVIPEESTVSPGSTVVISFTGDNNVEALVTPADGGAPSVSEGTASIQSDSGADQLIATVTFTGGELDGETVVIVLDYDTDNTGLFPTGSGSATVILSDNTTIAAGQF